MNIHKIHLLKESGIPKCKILPGHYFPIRLTDDPGKVTCQRCKGVTRGHKKNIPTSDKIEGV